MIASRSLLSASVVFGFICSASVLSAVEQVVAEKDGARFVVAPYLLAANISGTVGLGRASGVPVEVDTGDILEHLEAGGMLHAEMWVKDWGVLGEVVFMTLGEEVTATGPLGATQLTADVEITEAVYELALAYRFRRERLDLDIIAGIRAWDLSVDADLSGALVENGITGDESWVDPLIGVRADYHLTDTWSLIMRGDIGGFGVGADFAWNAAAFIGWAPARWCTLLAGYRAVGVDYDNDKDGQGAFAYDTITNGAVLGAAFFF